MQQTTAAADRSKWVGEFLRQFDGLRAQRTQYDARWQMVSDHILPRRDFSITPRPNQLRPHKVTSSVATNANARLAALLLAYLIDPTTPFLLPNAKRGLVAAGRPSDLDDAARDYLSDLSWTIFDHMLLPKAQLMLRLNSMLQEFCAFGCGVIWTGRKRGFGPYYNTKPLQACWWSENEQGEIDTLYFRMLLPLYRVFQRWPAARALEGWTEMAGKVDGREDEETLTPIVLACRPRIGGKVGAVTVAKPFAFVAIAEEKKAILEETGYDTFPYAVFRYNPMPGQAYALGPGCQVLPDVMVLNYFQQAVERVASNKAEPPFALPARMFAKALDLRRGAPNYYNPAGLGLMRADQAIQKLDFTGDITEAVAYKQSLIDDIELGYFVDWLRLREAGDMTAEEVNERRDMRLRGMSSIVACMEMPMTQLGDRTLEGLIAEQVVARPPAQLSGTDIDWEYAGPLAIQQLRGNVRSALELLNARQLAAGTDPAAAEAVNLEENLRLIAEGLGLPSRATNGREHVAQVRAQRAAASAAQADVEKVAALAGAAKDAGQAAGALQGAPGAAAPFAPASPFAQPVAA